MRILINKQNNDKLKKKYVYTSIGELYHFHFFPTSGLFCKDATHILIKGEVLLFLKVQCELHIYLYINGQK